MPSDIRVRVAPSPTGFLHIGTAQSALYNYLFARHNKGVFVVRIEDTDKERSLKEYEDDILEGLRWLGLEWDEFYRQSDRTQIYAKYIEKLLEEDKAFWCYHSPEELEAEQKELQEKKLPPLHVCTHKAQKPNDKIQTGKNGVIRLKVNEKSDRKIVVEDIIRGRVEFQERLLGDFSIAKDINTPLFHFSNVVDDYETTISHVIRGEDHLANTPKHILIQEALGFETPRYAHLPLLLGTDRSKLSKRYGSTSLRNYRGEGYLPEAVVNYLGLLSFTSADESKSEIISKNSLIEIFDLGRVHKSGAVFDIEKLKWVNGEYIKSLPDQELIKLIKGYDNEILERAIKLIKERIKKLADISEFYFFFSKPEYDPALLVWKDSDKEKTIEILKRIHNELEKIEFKEKTDIKHVLDNISRESNKGSVYWPARVALSGAKSSPDPIDIAYVIGKKKTLDRLKIAVSKLNG